MPEIIPAILTDNPDVFKSQMQAVKTFKANCLQIDFTDGKFVPSKTLLPDELDAFVLSDNSLILEAHLMVVEPEQYFSTLYTLGFTRIAVHFQTLDDPQKTIDLAHEFGFEVGIAINPDIELNQIEPFIGSVEYILFMTVVPGEQGHPFEEKVLEKIQHQSSVNQKNKPVIIETDGAANKDTIPKLKKAGAQRIAVGSAIWKADDPAQAFLNLQKLAI